MATSRTKMVRGLALASAVVLAAGAESAWGQHPCGTVPTSEAVERMRALWSAGEEGFPPSASQNEHRIVPVSFHVVRRSDGTGGLCENRLARALEDANRAFLPVNLEFCRVGPTFYIGDDGLWRDIDTRAELDRLRSIDPLADAVNVYFTSHVETEADVWCGYASFPGEVVQGIVMDNDCTGRSSNPATFPHELGHVFNLFHTHETAFGVECVDGSNCEQAGDLLCDTPADPELSDDVNENCHYADGPAGPCAGDPPYAPDTANLMSYSRFVCRDRFTPQQIDRMLSTLQDLRPELINAECPWRGPCEATNLRAARGDQFGTAAAVSGDLAVIGAPNHENAGRAVGAAYVYRRIDSNWIRQQKLLASEGALNDSFGASVALSGNVIVVGAPGADHFGIDRGSAYVFRLNGSNWVEEEKLLASDGETRHLFGTSVAISGNTIVVGAPPIPPPWAHSPGRVYVF